MEPTKKPTESSTEKSMYSVVERMNDGYAKYFDSKLKTSDVRSECYSNFMSCGASSKNKPKLCVEVKTEEGISENRDIVQQFFPQHDEAKEPGEANEQDRVIAGSGCCKYLVKKEK